MTGQVLVAFDEGRIDTGALLETVRAVEKAHGTRDEDFPWSRPVHPADPTAVTAAAVEFAADCVAVGAAVTGQLTRLPALPRSARLAAALIELEPPLRRKLKRRIGPMGTDVVLALSAAALHGMTQGPATPAVDAIFRLELLMESLSRRSVWQRREPELCCTPEAMPHEAPMQPERPRPRPPGPIETWADQLGPGALTAAGAVLAMTRNTGRAADTLLAAVPRAAKTGRGGFAATAARHMASQGVVTLNAAALRRLDRVSAIVIDSSMLCTQRPHVVAAEGQEAQMGELWRAAERALNGQSMADVTGSSALAAGEVSLERDAHGDEDRPGGASFVVRRAGRPLGTVIIAAELEPLAEPLVDAARDTGALVLLTEHAAVSELLPRADDHLDDGQPLVHHVRRLQEEGQGVLVISGSADEALAAADVGVTVMGREGCVCWSADLVCGPSLEDACRIMAVAGAARPVSERSVQLAKAGSALAVLLALVGGRRRGPSYGLAPVNAAALISLANGTLAGRRAARRPIPPPVVHVAWHAMEPLDVVRRLAESTGNRRSDRRLLEPVRLVARTPPIPQLLAPARAGLMLSTAVREELQDPLTPVLAVGAVASAIVGSAVDAMLVGAAMGGNALVSGTQRMRAERALQRLLAGEQLTIHRVVSETDPVALAERLCAGDDADLRVEPVAAERVEPGDVICLGPTDMVPADARLLSAAALEVDEATLTGESVPVAKGVESTPGAPLAERTGMVFEGTTVVAGAGHAVVVAVGDATEAGRAARAAGKAAPPAGLQARLGEVTRMALPATTIGGAAVTGLAAVRGIPLREAVGAGVAVAVAAVPEGLPLVATVAQAAAARRLSRHGVLVRSSRTLEALGRVDTVCFDKTGTLTEGRLAVTRFASPQGDLPDDSGAAKRLLHTASRACPRDGNVPHATDRAVLEAAERSGADLGGPVSAELPFESNRGYSASLGQLDGRRVLAVKGAPEVVVPLCDSVLTHAGRKAPITDSRRRASTDTMQRLAAEGLRVLAVAERRTSLPADTDDVDALVSQLTLLGFVGIADRPRPGAADAVRQMSEDGVRPVMMTGDHPVTARALAAEVGLPCDGVLTGSELDQMTVQRRVRAVGDATVFARVSPEQKVRIVEALRAGGRVVAMIGDGTNDAAAIRVADVGIGVAAAGSAAAKSAADLVLAEPDLRRIHDALVAAQGMWRRVRDAVAILVGGNAGEVAFMVLVTALSGRAPLGVRQLLLVNMFTDMFPALAVALAPSRRTEENGGAAPATTTLKASLARAVAVRGTTTALGATGAWAVGRFTGRRRRAGSMGLAALVGTQLGQTLLIGWRSPRVVATSTLSAIALFAVIETPGVSQFFGCTPLGPIAWAIVVASSTVATLAAEFAPHLIPALRPDAVA